MKKQRRTILPIVLRSSTHVNIGTVQPAKRGWLQVINIVPSTILWFLGLQRMLLHYLKRFAGNPLRLD